MVIWMHEHNGILFATLTTNSATVTAYPLSLSTVVRIAIGMHLYRNRASGCTFAEIIIVVGMIGLLAVIALPNLAKATRKQEKKQLPLHRARKPPCLVQNDIGTQSSRTEPASRTNGMGAEPATSLSHKQPAAVRIANNRR